ncbi:MAG: baseplate J/gp47 family protein [Synergistaceae bacterium]|nr:baseplate J/gp47 family protein [Synergistaceae bacterium]
MSRNPEYKFIDTDTATLEASLVAAYEKITSVTVRPASPERLFIQWVASIITLERVQENYAANQNIPSRAEGENLDALGELFYVTERPDAKSATCMMRFFISEPQVDAILVPAGTRVTDVGKEMIWETQEDAYIPVGSSSVDVRVYCQTVGTVGNGYQVGQLNTIVDVFDYYSECANITESDGGSDRLTDDEYYALMRASMDGYSTAGGVGNYIYHAKGVSSEISDVVANSPSPGEVRIYVLMEDGGIAGAEIKTAVYEACNADTVRPMTDHVEVNDADVVGYDIDFTYYIPTHSAVSSADIAARVAAAVQEFIEWQSAKLGRDINPSTLIQKLMTTGIKRVELRAPTFQKLRDGQLSLAGVYDYSETVPQVAKVGNVTATNGGYEDE